MSIRLAWVRASIAALAVCVGCGDDGPPPPPGRFDGGMFDAGRPRDGGRRDGGRRDAGGGDAGPPDATVDAGPECVMDMDCDDGLACNGPEGCDRGVCVAGIAVECVDGLACTVDTCEDPAGSCVFTPDDALCDADERCITAGDRGCVETCTTAATCDDGTACNGVEVCDLAEGLCGPGAAVDCNDGIDCTLDMCMEPDGDCVFTADDTLCDLGETCVTAASRGCIVACGAPVGYCEVLTPQCGCAIGDGCYLGASGRTCAPAGTLGVGSACGSLDACEIGAGCRSIGGTARMCAQFCDPATAPTCTGTGRCVDSGSPTTYYCTQSCDPIAQTGCPAASACRADAAGYTDCRSPVGVGGQGYPCTADAACGAGFACVTSACRQYCVDGGGTVCPGSTVCSVAAFSSTLGTRTIGVCM